MTTANVDCPQLVSLVAHCASWSARGNNAVTHIVNHCTATSSFGPVKNEFLNAAAQRSAHYVIDKDGKVYQFVRLDHIAWHCRGANKNSVGIEHVATATDRLTPAQEKSSAQLQAWLCAQFKLDPLVAITGHRWTPGELTATTCPDALWATQQELREWVRAQVFPLLEAASQAAEV